MYSGRCTNKQASIQVVLYSRLKCETLRSYSTSNFCYQKLQLFTSKRYFAYMSNIYLWQTMLLSVLPNLQLLYNVRQWTITSRQTLGKNFDNSFMINSFKFLQKFIMRENCQWCLYSVWFNVKNLLTSLLICFVCFLAIQCKLSSS